MIGKLKRTNGEWAVHHACYRYMPDDGEDFSPSIYPIDKDSLDYLSELTMLANPEGRSVEFEVIHRDLKGEIISDFHAVPIEEWTWEAKLIPPAAVFWREELKKVKQCPQRQDSVTDQLISLYQIAVRFGLYDAADYLNVK